MRQQTKSTPALEAAGFFNLIFNTRFPTHKTATVYHAAVSTLIETKLLCCPGGNCGLHLVWIPHRIKGVKELLALLRCHNDHINLMIEKVACFRFHICFLKSRA